MRGVDMNGVIDGEKMELGEKIQTIETKLKSFLLTLRIGEVDGGERDEKVKQILELFEMLRELCQAEIEKIKKEKEKK